MDVRNVTMPKQRADSVAARIHIYAYILVLVLVYIVHI